MFSSTKYIKTQNIKNNGISSNKSNIKTLQKEIEIYKKILENLTNEKLDNPLECQICMENLTRTNLGFMSECNHYYCRNCIKQYIMTNIDDNTLDIECLHPKCNVILSQHMLLKFVSEKTMAKYYNSLLNICVAKSKDMIFCPKPTCSKICIKGECSNKVNCLYCYNQFCFVCKVTYKDKHKCEHKDLMKDIPTEILESFDNKDKVKICPQCRNIIEKKDGCNTMKCKLCDTQFCWECLCTHDTIINDKSHKCKSYYNHYDEEEDEEEHEEEDEEDVYTEEDTFEETEEDTYSE